MTSVREGTLMFFSLRRTLDQLDRRGTNTKSERSSCGYLDISLRTIMHNPRKAPAGDGMLSVSVVISLAVPSELASIPPRHSAEVGGLDEGQFPCSHN